MIIKTTLCVLVFALIAVIALSYYINKEGFDTISGSMTTTPAVPPTMPSTVPPTSPSTAPPTVPPSSITKPKYDNGTIPQRTDIAPQVSLTNSGCDAMSLQQRTDLLANIQKIVKNEILANRGTTCVTTANKDSSKMENSAESTATIQGKEYENSCYKDTDYRCPKNPDGSCPPVPDMSQYIKKDAIPCWGCSIDY